MKPAEHKANTRRFSELARTVFLSRATIDQFTQSATPSQMKAVVAMLEHETAVRAIARRQRNHKRARFPVMKDLASFDRTDLSFPEGWAWDDLAGLGWIDQDVSLVFHGPTGRGKTHLAIALGVEAIEANKTVRYFPVATLALDLARAASEGRLDRMLTDLAKTDLLILDEFGYIPLEAATGRLLFQVVAGAYERQALIITTNIEFSRWGSVLGDDKLAAAMIDRIVHHGRLLEFGGTSRRMSNALMLQNTTH